MPSEQPQSRNVLVYCSPAVKKVLRSCKHGEETFDEVLDRIVAQYDPDSAESGEVER